MITVALRIGTKEIILGEKETLLVCACLQQIQACIQNSPKTQSSDCASSLAGLENSTAGEQSPLLRCRDRTLTLH